MLPSVADLRVKDGFVLWLRFSDGAEGEWDFADIVAQTGPMVEPLKDPDYFRRVFLEWGAPTWPNGYDVAPDALYERMSEAKRLSRPPHAA
jgi:hypothetical protein